MFVFAGVKLVAMELNSTVLTVEIVSLLLLTERENLGAISHVATQRFKIVSAPLSNSLRSTVNALYLIELLGVLLKLNVPVTYRVTNTET